MSKMLDNVLENVSENNNDYRIELRNLNNKIDEKATSIIGDVVTLSNYSLDFSNAISKVKEEIVNPISRLIENYAIKDLRSVESVNEQFIEKINDKIENTKMDSFEEKEKFIDNLNSLLNNKYLQIVEIKRTNFFNEENKNEEIESIINNFTSYLKENSTCDEYRLNEIFSNFINDIYELIKDSLANISNLYLNNFVSAVKNSLDNESDYKEEVSDINENSLNSYMPDINPVMDIPPVNEEVNIEPKVDLPSLANNEEFDISSIPFAPSSIEETEEINNNNNSILMDIPEVSPIVVDNDYDKKESKPSYSYDVEEILKIAKSPVASVPNFNANDNYEYKEEKKDDVLSSLETDLNERELVNEMIRRLKDRLEKIDKRESKLEDDKIKVDSDENFVNDLIKNAESKKEELDEFEKSLDEKEKELDIKEKELNEKIKNVMPFANAVLNTEKESN